MIEKVEALNGDTFDATDKNDDEPKKVEINNALAISNSNITDFSLQEFCPNNVIISCAAGDSRSSAAFITKEIRHYNRR